MPQQKREPFSIGDTAERLEVSTRTVRRLIAKGELRTIQYHPKPGLGARTGISADDLDAFIKERTNVA